MKMTKIQLQKWNGKYPDGSPCFTVSDDGEEFRTTTKGSAFMSECEPVVMVENCSVPYLISRLRMADRKKVPHAKCLSFAPPLHRPDEDIENYARPILRKRIFTLTDLVYAAETRRSVVCPNWAGWNKPKPASFVINLTGFILNRMLLDGIYIYEKPKL